MHSQFCRNSELEALAIREFFLILETLIKHVTFCELWTEMGSEQTVENPA